jgi:multidrug efflux pump subunit AcrA (membrane-fusion protein)
MKSKQNPKNGTSAGIKPAEYLNMSTVINRTIRIQTGLKSVLYRFYKFITRNLLAHPERSFFSVLGILFIMIIVGNFTRRPPVVQNTEAAVKSVPVFSVGSAPKLKMTARIEKSGAIKITAQTAGVVQTVNFTEGQKVSRGSQLFWLSTNYQGGTIPSVSRQIAEANNKFVNDNYESQLGSIKKRRDLANAQYNQYSDLRDITSQSVDATRQLISFNEQLGTSVDNQLALLNSTNENHANDALILQVSQAKSGIMSGLLSLKTSLRNTEYQIDQTKAPNSIASSTKDLALAGLDMEEKSLNLNKEISGLNLTLARISESLMYPASPVNGTVERIYVSVGQNINPGTILATITGTKNTATAIVSVSREIDGKISQLEPSIAYIGGDQVELTPKYVSNEPTEGSFNSILYTIPEPQADRLANGSSITIDIPVGSAEAASTIPYIPLDAVFQTQSEAYLFVASGSAGTQMSAESRKIILGPVYGAYVEVTDGLNKGDQIILDRSVIDGDRITIKN